MELIASYQCRSRSIVRYVLPAFRDFNLVNVSDAGVYCSTVHVYDVLAFSAVGLLDSVLHVSYCFIDRNDVGKLEESSLKN